MGRTGSRQEVDAQDLHRKGARRKRAEQMLATMPKSKMGESIEPARSVQSLGSAVNYTGEQKSKESMQGGAEMRHG